ncbi:MAG: LysR family transcriptional regulator [Janthinobacterium lividum]
MESKWLEDFISLAETRSFSRSAALRHVTQPAFSRRIQALEAWLGAELIDRSGYPTRLTQAGNIFHAQALTMLSQTQEARMLLRGQNLTSAAMIDFAVPHTLSLTFFPGWIEAIDQRVRDVTMAGPDGAPRPVCPDGRLRAKLRALNVHDAVLSLTEGGCDLMMGYHHPSHPVVLDPRRYEFVALGMETISPFCAPRWVSAGASSHGASHGFSRARPASPDTGSPRFSLPGRAGAPIPYLAYSPGAYLGRMTEVLLMRAPQPLFLDRVYETDMAEGLKLMALAGHGLAFLPHSAAADALASGRLVAPGLSPELAGEGAACGDAALAPDPEGGHAPAFSLTMEIRLYRDRLQEGDPARAALIDAVWQAARDVAQKK